MTVSTTSFDLFDDDTFITLINNDPNSSAEEYELARATHIKSHPINFALSTFADMEESNSMFSPIRLEQVDQYGEQAILDPIPE